MKHKIFLLFLIVFNLSAKAQTELNIPLKFPTDFGKFTFALGSKITIELNKLDNDKYEYKVLSIESIKDYYSLDRKEDLFSKKPQANTIELFFMGAYYNEGKDDKDWKTVLKLRNNLENPISYKADIRYYYSDKFENTSIVGAFPKTTTNEIWGNKIDYIIIYDFEKLDTNKNSANNR